ncbi:MAG TPA: hypothetical protein VGP55_03705 [Chitinophagaceae bacterium]|nr:hypothetical protein [Chitinophagaceae bacterium]
MKKLIVLLMITTAFLSNTSNAQLQKGNILVGGDLASLNLTLGGGGAFQVRIDPKAAFFIKDNVALGAYIDFGLATAKGAGTTTDYGLGALGRYYANDAKVNVLKHGRLFFEGNVGIQGVSLSGGSNTTGLGVGVGPGYAYFITPNIGLETLLKYNGIVGFGSQAYRSNLNLGIGFQIYLPGKSARQIINDVK